MQTYSKVIAKRHNNEMLRSIVITHTSILLNECFLLNLLFCSALQPIFIPELTGLFDDSIDRKYVNVLFQCIGVLFWG